MIGIKEHALSLQIPATALSNLDRNRSEIKSLDFPLQVHFLAQNVAQNLPENAKNHTVPAALGQLAAKDAAGLTQL